MLSVEVNYLGQMEDPPVIISFNRQASNLVFDPRVVDVQDMRMLPDADCLDDKGFRLAELPFDRAPGEDAETHLDELRACMEEYLKEVTGAPKIFFLGPYVRHSDPARAEPSKTPAHFIHGDYSASSFARIARAMVAGEPDSERWLSGHYALYQTWTAVSPPPHDSLLAFLDRSTLSPDDIVTGSVVAGTPLDPQVHPALLLKHNPAHRWYYASGMTPGDTFIFLGYDSRDNALPGPPHTAFVNPVAGAVHRVSVEMRAFVFWG
jgi:hypothetical protein